MECNIFENRLSWKTFYVFRLFYFREWNSWKSKNSWYNVNRFRWALDLCSRTGRSLFHLNWNRCSSENILKVFLFLKSLKRNLVLFHVFIIYLIIHLPIIIICLFNLFIKCSSSNLLLNHLSADIFMYVFNH